MKLIQPTRTNTTTEGRARTGEVGPKGLVTHRETWAGNTAVVAQPGTIHYCYDDDGNFRKLTMVEMVAKGYFILGRGPLGFA